MTATMTWRFGRRNEFADAIRQIERNAGATRGRARTMWGSLFTVLLFGTLLFISSVATSAADMRGDQFITMMDGNMLYGRDHTGASYNLYFLPGGQATYTGRAGSDIQGAWDLDKDGDVCVRWSRRVEPVTGCFVVTTRGDKVTWRSKRHRGDVVETLLKARTVDPRGHESASR